MKIIIKAIFPIFLFAISLASCNSSAAPSRPIPTDAMETALSIAWTEVAETQTAAAPTITPTLPLPTSLASTTPESTLTPSPTEDVTFWENLGPMPSNISITEYAIPPDKDPTENDGLFEFVPTQVWIIPRKIVISPTPQQITIKQLGYETRSIYSTSGTVAGFQLYRDGRLLFDNLAHVSKVYTFSTDNGPITAFMVETDTEMGRQRYVVQNDAVYSLGAKSIDDIEDFRPILYKGELLWANMYSDYTEIKKSNGVVILTIPGYWMIRHRFFAWNGHWIFETDDTVVVDGEILNQKFGFEEVFHWGLVNDKPTYFFRKGSRIGLSYDGQILPINYHDVAHNLCCSPAQNNPSMGNDVIHFFGERDGAWYYVEVKIN